VNGEDNTSGLITRMADSTAGKRKAVLTIAAVTIAAVTTPAAKMAAGKTAATTIVGASRAEPKFEAEWTPGRWFAAVRTAAANLAPPMGRAAQWALPLWCDPPALGRAARLRQRRE
jgi:hypothetical protein